MIFPLSTQREDRDFPVLPHEPRFCRGKKESYSAIMSSKKVQLAQPTSDPSGHYVSPSIPADTKTLLLTKKPSMSATQTLAKPTNIIAKPIKDDGAMMMDSTRGAFFGILLVALVGTIVLWYRRLVA